MRERVEMKKVIADDLRARYNENGNFIIPNTFQHPNIFIDELMYFLTPEENICLTWAVRRILGFQANIMSRRDNISLSQFTDGIKTEDGRWLSRGCGLGVNTIRAALEGLEKYKVLIPTSGKPNPVKGQEYWLQDNKNSIDWDALEERKSVKISQYQQRTAKATEKSLKSRGYVGRNTKISGITSDVRQGVTSDVRQGVTSDVNTKPTETHRNPLSAGAEEKKATDAPSWKYRELFQPELLTLADLVAEKFGAPIKTKHNNQVALYLETIESWHLAGITPADWQRAVKIVGNYSNPIVKITGMTDPLKTAAQERKAKNKSAEKQSPADTQPVRYSRSEAQARGLIKQNGAS
jgi:hypothetical protein